MVSKKRLDYLKRYRQTPKFKAWRKRYNQENRKKHNEIFSNHYYIKHNSWYKGNQKLSRLTYKRYIDPNLPDDYDVHHRDHDQQNNSLGNLLALPHGLHSHLHRQHLI